ncbi:hypothetical protein [Chitinophaga arvensicola]|uniref:Uncharacterized protein n=1 Tax=Chitinophaga arvensicola TaxID=29529 RepID=A0A1I0S9X1_9BACT|nr:hypothetical protein [Chitinophaga arvensicola]SEW53041.1 hypothetical protein SAMN04488122_5311 [Chitinophaga arvensicola]
MLTGLFKTGTLSCCMMLLCVSLYAQNLQGVWKGWTAAESQGWFYGTGSYIMEIKNAGNGKYKATAWFYETPQLYGEVTVTGLRNDSAGKYRFQELKFNRLTIPKNYSARLATMQLSLFDIDGEMVLQGPMISYSKYTGKIRTKRTVRLSKLSELEIAALRIPGSNQLFSGRDTTAADIPVVAAIGPKAPEAVKPVRPPVATPLPKPATTPPPIAIMPDTARTPALPPRENRIQGSYEIREPGIDITLYDYGTIDHDTITVFFNGVKVADRQELTASPLRMHLLADPGREYQELLLHANNLGDIPPNTAKMIIMTSDKRYELKVTSSETENAMIRFHYLPQNANKK